MWRKKFLEMETSSYINKNVGMYKRTFGKEAKAQKHKRVLLLLLFFAIISVALNAVALFCENHGIGKIGTDFDAQLIPFQKMINENWSKGNFFWAWENGLSGDIFSGMSYYYSTSPFFIIAFIVKKLIGVNMISYNSIYMSIVIEHLVKRFLCMTFMYMLMAYTYPTDKKWNWQAVLSAIICGGSLYFIQPGYDFSFMLNDMVYIPLICLGVQRYIREKKYLLFVISLSLMVGNSFYFGYIGCIFVLVYILIQAWNKGNKLKEYVSGVLKLGGLSLVGVLMSMIFFLPSILTLFNINRTPVALQFDFLPSFKEIQNKLLEVFVTTYSSVFGWSMLVLLIIVLVNKKYKFVKTDIIFVVWLILFFMPITENIMGGGGDSGGRWKFIMSIALAMALPRWVAYFIENKLNIVQKILILGMVLVLSYKLLQDKGITQNWNMPVGKILLVAVIILQLIFMFGLTLGIIKNKKVSICAIIVVLCTTIIYNNYSELNENYRVNKAYVKPDSTIAETLKNYDTGFYRVSDKNIEKNIYTKNNDYMKVKINGISEYNSLISKNISKWIKNEHNTGLTYNINSMYNGLGDRRILENLWGVKYIVNPDSKPYGYTLVKSNNSEKIYKNENFIGVDMWYNKYIDENAYKNFNLACKDTALMQGALVKDNKYLNKIEIDDSVSEINVTKGNWTLKGCSWQEDGKLEVAQNDASINIPVTPRSNGQYMITLNMTGHSQIETGINRNTISVDGQMIRFLSGKTSVHKTYLTGINQYTFMAKQNTDNIQVKLTAGTYDIKSVNLYYISYDKLSEWTANLNKYNIENLVVDGGNVIGNINNGEDGLLAFNIPYSKGWTCYVDGEKVDTQEVNDVFLGVFLAKGNHSIELKYISPGFLPGLAITVITICGIVVVAICKRRQKKSI